MIHLAMFLQAGPGSSVVELILLAIVVIGGLIKALTNAAQAANQKSKTQIPGLEPRKRNEPASPAVTLEDFLARVNRQRASAQRAERRSEPPFVTAEVVDAEIVGGESVAQHVKRQFGAKSLSQRHLQERIAAEETAREAAVERKFKHQVGRLSGSSTSDLAPPPEPPSPLAPELSGAAAPPGAAAELMRMLSSPLGVRQAVILNEILKRPDFT